MKVRKYVLACGALGLAAAVSTIVLAQGPAPPAGQGGGGGLAVGAGGPLVPAPVPPPQNFATSTEHFEYLHRLHKGGTRHTYESLPKWEGLWSLGGHNGANNLFLQGGNIIPGVLTPAYEAAFKRRRDLGAQYDRLTHCEPAGMPRWLNEPYVREFVNTPSQSWWLNDLSNDTRRIYIDQEHKNIEGTHSPNGDSIGFWVGDMLIVHTVDVYPNDYQRGTPPTSNQFESVEIWREIPFANGDRRLSVNITVYDSVALQRPLTATYTFQRATDQEAAGFRIRHWECDSNQNTFLVTDSQGRPSTQFRLPGEPGFDDVRGVDPKRNPDLPPDLPGQERNPVFNEALK